MKLRSGILLTGLMTFGIVGPSSAATPEQVGVYGGTAKYSYYDIGTGKKITENETCLMQITNNNNTISLSLGINSWESVAAPLTPTGGGFYNGNGGPALTAVFGLKNGSVKGTFQYVSPYFIAFGTLKLKKLPPA